MLKFREYAFRKAEASDAGRALNGANLDAASPLRSRPSLWLRECRRLKGSGGRLLSNCGI